MVYDDSTHTARLIPNSDLEYDTFYAVTVTSDVRSRAGVAMEAESWVFTTNTEEDITPPSIVESSPSQDYYVAVDTEIYVVFSETVFNVGGNTFYLKDNSTGKTVSATVDYSHDTQTATLNAGTLKEWTSYTLFVTDSITDGAGNHLSA